MALKTCEKCGNQQSTKDFYNKKNSIDGLSKWCKSCDKRRVKISNTDVRKNDLKRRYNLTINQYNELFNKQCGYCYICLTHQDSLKNKLSVDHNHKTGQIRGLLCQNCNTALGKMKESSFLLERMIDYLKKFNGESQ